MKLQNARDKVRLLQTDTSLHMPAQMDGRHANQTEWTESQPQSAVILKLDDEEKKRMMAQITP